MEPNRFGRKLGIGVRVASRMAKERVAQAGNTPASPPPPATAAPRPAASAAPRPQSPPRPAKNYVDPARRVGQGTRQFGKAFFGPFARVSGTLWLEVTGLFFALFALFFAQNAYKVRTDALHGPEHAHFLHLRHRHTHLRLLLLAAPFLKAARRDRKARR